MVDFDLLVKLGWTALLGWNLRETVANGKKIVKLETMVENGLSTTVDNLVQRIDEHIDGEDRRLQTALSLQRTTARRGERRTPSREAED